MTDIHNLSLIEQSRQIHSGKLSPVEITNHYLDRIRKYNSQLNAFIRVFPDRALAQAKAMETLLNRGIDLGPLHGICFAAKDLFDIRGVATTAGCRLLEDNIAVEDAEAVELLHRAGMICVGKTHTVQFAYSGIGINHDYGTPHNPWKKCHYIPGGSSSGSAVAVAASMIPAALGTDTGGSIRVPAALCGITGLKTTVGRISREGVYPLSRTMDSVGPMTHSAEDALFLYRAMNRIGHKNETRRERLNEIASGLSGNCRGMRMAFAESMFWDSIHPEVEQSVRNSGAVFKELGASIESIRFSEAEETANLNSNGLIIAAEAFAANRHWLENHFDQLDPVVAHRMKRGETFGAHEYIQNMHDLDSLKTKVYRRLAEIDILIAPATIIPAEPVSEIDREMEHYTRKNIDYLKNTSIGNMLNLCGISIPCGFTTDGLPIGLMLCGKPFDEETILRAAHAFQNATQWHLQRPDLSVFQ